MASNTGVVQFTPVNTGDMRDIPPDLPAGVWEAQCTVKQAKTSKDSFPMLVLDWKTTEDMTGNNESMVGAKAADFVTFFPQSHPASRMSKQKLKSMCDAFGIEVPTTDSLKKGSWSDLEEFIEELDGKKATIYTKVVPRKDNGQNSTVISYTQPGSGLGKAKAAAEDDDEDDAPAKKPAAKAKARR